MPSIRSQSCCPLEQASSENKHTVDQNSCHKVKCCTRSVQAVTGSCISSQQNSWCGECVPNSWCGESGLTSWYGEPGPTSWCGESGLTSWCGEPGHNSWCGESRSQVCKNWETENSWMNHVHLQHGFVEAPVPAQTWLSRPKPAWKQNIRLHIE